VLLDGRPTLSCLTLAWTARGRNILTVEGLSSPSHLHPLQQAFLDVGAVQCGFCTPGMLLAAKALLDANPDPTREEVRRALAGNLCRCTGYVKIVDAVLAAAAVIRSEAGTTAGGEAGVANASSADGDTDDAVRNSAGHTEECVSW